MDILFQRVNEERVVKDEYGRVIMKINGGRVAISRFPQMNEELKEYIANVYTILTGVSGDFGKAMDFLNYEIERETFCS